jgi:phosphatidylglycerophosphate synthase
MRGVQSGAAIGFAVLVAMLGALTVTVGLGGRGWLVGIACGSAICIVIARAMPGVHGSGMGAANRVTTTRAMLACGVAALTAESFDGSSPVKTLVALSVVALVLDAVDGFIARHTRTSSRFGARFDMEVDAFLILVLSVYVAHTTAQWVLAMGLARYAFLAARLLLPRLRGSAPPRRWCKVVAAVQGIVLTVALADVLPPAVAKVALAVALVMLTESFGREAWELWRAGSDVRLRPAELAGAGTVSDG